MRAVAVQALSPAARVAARLAKLMSRSWLAARLKVTAAAVLVPAMLATGASLAGYGCVYRAGLATDGPPSGTRIDRLSRSAAESARG